jgi:hypothetical protein
MLRTDAHEEIGRDPDKHPLALCLWRIAWVPAFVFGPGGLVGARRVYLPLPACGEREKWGARRE